MNLKCKINENEYPIVQGVPFSDEYNETLDSGTIKVSHVYKMEDLRPFDDVIIWDSNYEYLGYDENGIPLFKGHIFKSWDVLSGFPKYDNDITIFFKHLLVDSFSYEILNLMGNADNKTIYQYDISLFSETKGLEVVQLPNLSITEPLNINKKISVWDYMNKYIELYCPRYKRKKENDDGTYSDVEWEFVTKYKLHPSLKNIFEHTYSPDFDLTGPNLKDILSRLMITKDMIPYVKNNIIYAIDQTQRNGIFDDNRKYIASVTGNMSSANYCDSLRTTYSEAISDESSCRYIENLGFRNSDSALMTLENMRIETQFPIYKINSLKMCYYKKYSIYNGTKKIKDKTFLCKQDITPLVKLNTERNLLSQDWKKFNKEKSGISLKKMAKYKMATIGYDIGSKYISGWGQKYQYPEGIILWEKSASYIENIFRIVDRLYPTGNMSVDDLLKEDGFNIDDGYFIVFDDDDLDGIITPFEPKFDVVNKFVNLIGSWKRLGQHVQIGAERLKSFVFQIDYQGFYSGAVIHSKDIGRDDIVINNNPNSGLTMLEKDGLYQKEQLNRFGNEVVTIKARYEDISQLQPLGSVFGDDIIIYHREYTIYDTFIQAQYIGSKDYVLKNYYTSVYARHRTWSLMNYNEAITRAENKKIFVLLDKDESYFELNNDKMFLMEKFDNIKPIEYILSFLKENRSTNESVVNLGYILHGGNLYLVNTNIFINGYSLCFNLAMPDSISAGMYISEPTPDMDSELDIKDTIFDKIDDALNLDTSELYRFLLMWDVKDDYTGSLQEWYPLIDDNETGFTEKIGFYLAKDNNDALLNNKILDGNKSEFVKNDIYNFLFSYPKMASMYEFDRVKSTYRNRDNVVFDSLKFTRNDIIKGHDQEEYVFTSEVIDLNMEYQNGVLNKATQTIDVLNEETFEKALAENDEYLNLYYSDFAKSNEANSSYWKLGVDVIGTNIGKVENLTIKEADELNVEKLKKLHNLEGFNRISFFYTNESDGTKTWILNHEWWNTSNNEIEKIYTIAFKEQEYMENIFGIEPKEDLKPGEIALCTYMVNQTSQYVKLNDLGLSVDGISYIGDSVLISCNYKLYLNLGENVEIEDLDDFGIYWSPDEKDNKLILKSNENIIIKTTKSINLSNIIGNEYTLWKDNKEKIDMTYQIEPITRDRDILFSHWFMKLSDLNNHYKKNDASYLIEKNELTFDGTMEMYYSTYQQKVNNLPNPRYPIVFFKISKDFFENNLMVGSFICSCLYLQTWPDGNWDKNKIDLFGYRDYITKASIDFKEITNIDKINKQVTFSTSETIGYHLAEKSKFKTKTKEFNRKITLDREWEENGIEYYGGYLIFEDYGPYTGDTFGLGDTGVMGLKGTYRYIASNGYKISNGDQIDLSLNFRKVSFSSLLKPTMITNYVRNMQNMFVCTSKNKMKNTLVYDKYQFVDTFFIHESYNKNDIVIYEGKLYRCIKEQEKEVFNPANWEDISNNTYLKGSHLCKVGWSNEDWKKVDLNIEQHSVLDIFKIEKDVIGRTYIYVDLTNIEGSSVQYWYANGNSFEFVFGVNFTEEDKQKGYIKIYVSLLSSRDTRVYDENHNVIGEMWNYAKSDTLLLDNGQYYYDGQNLDDYRQIMLSKPDNIGYKVYINDEQLDADLEDIYLAPKNSNVTIYFEGYGDSYIGNIYVNGERKNDTISKTNYVSFVLDKATFVSADSKIPEYTLKIDGEYTIIEKVVRVSSPIANNKTNDLLYSYTWNYKEFKGSKVSYGDIIRIDKKYLDQNYSVIGLDENNAVIGDVIITGHSLNVVKFYNDLNESYGVTNILCYKKDGDNAPILISNQDPLKEGDSIWFEATALEGYNVVIEYNKDNPLIVGNKDIYTSDYIKITSSETGTEQCNITITSELQPLNLKVTTKEGEILYDGAESVVTFNYDEDKIVDVEIKYSQNLNVNDSLVSTLEMEVLEEKRSYDYEDIWKSKTNEENVKITYWCGIKFSFTTAYDDMKFTIKGRDN